MTQEQIIEENKLIAVFMGYTIKPANNLYEKAWLPDGRTYYITTQLKFDTDWNWLIPVVEKIESMLYFFISAPFIDDETGILSGEHFCIVQHRNIDINLPYLIDVTGCSNKKEAIWKACVEFIKWYNNQK